MVVVAVAVLVVVVVVVVIVVVVVAVVVVVIYSLAVLVAMYCSAVVVVSGCFCCRSKCVWFWKEKGFVFSKFDFKNAKFGAHKTLSPYKKNSLRLC